MSRTFNMVGGGNVEKAVLAVTVTNGTPTSVTATKNGVSVSLVHDSTNDIWTGNVTPGTWTVTATDGTNSGSISVTVDDVKVYSRIVGMSELGGDYTKLEWISSLSDDCYIDTNYKPVSASKITCKFLVNQYEARPFTGEQTVDGNLYVIGLQIGSATFSAYYNGIKVGSGLWPSATLPNMSLNTEYTASTSNRTITINGTTTSITKGSSMTSNTYFSMLIARNCRMRYFTMTDSGGSTLVRNMVPARRNSDSAVGMYDKVNSVFYLPVSGVFTAGPAA